MRVLKKELWPYKVTVDNTTKIHDIETWLGTTYGAFRNRWNVVYQYNGSDYYFRKGPDATMFALRWA